jgi:hypothetical protein
VQAYLVWGALVGINDWMIFIVVVVVVCLSIYFLKFSVLADCSLL